MTTTCSTNHTLADALAALEESQFGPGPCAEARERLTDALATIEPGAFATATPFDQIARIGRLLYRSLGLRFGARDRGEDFTLTGTLLHRVGNCVGLTTAYIAAAEVLGAPLRPLLFEGHITASYVHDRGVTPVEVGRSGALLSQEVAARLYADAGPGRLLSNSELLAVHLSNRAAYVLSPRGEDVLALAAINRALELFPAYLGARINRAAVLVRLGHAEEAKSVLTHALEFRPSARYRQAIFELLKRVGTPAVLGPGRGIPAVF